MEYNLHKINFQKTEKNVTISNEFMHSIIQILGRVKQKYSMDISDEQWISHQSCWNNIFIK